MGKRSPPGSLNDNQHLQIHTLGPALCSETEDGRCPSCSLGPMPQSFAVPAATRAQLLAQAGDPAVGVAAPVKGTPFTLLSLAGVGTARPVLAAHLPSLQGGLKVLLGHLFPCHQEAPGHLGVLEDQGDQWLHLDLDHPGRSSHRHGEMKRRRPRGARDACTASLGHRHAGLCRPRGI